jgi:hypothetical protein
MNRLDDALIEFGIGLGAGPLRASDKKLHPVTLEVEVIARVNDCYAPCVFGHVRERHAGSGIAASAGPKVGDDGAGEVAVFHESPPSRSGSARMTAKTWHSGQPPHPQEEIFARGIHRFDGCALARHGLQSVDPGPTLSRDAPHFVHPAGFNARRRHPSLQNRRFPPLSGWPQAWQFDMT